MREVFINKLFQVGQSIIWSDFRYKGDIWVKGEQWNKELPYWTTVASGVTES